MFKAFFIHYNAAPGYHCTKTRNHAPRGWTAYIQPDTSDNTKCILSYALCNPKDQFCKATGRATAMGAVQKTVNKRDLPKELGRLDYLCENGHDSDWDDPKLYEKSPARLVIYADGRNNVLKHLL